MTLTLFCTLCLVISMLVLVTSITLGVMLHRIELVKKKMLKTLD